jgi:hypothetical protein
LRKNPYCDIYSHAEFFLRSNSIDHQNIVLAFLERFEREQAAFIARMFSRISLSTLMGYLGNRVNDLNEYLSKYSWRFEDNGQIIVTNEFYDKNYLARKDNLSFLNEMTVMMENISKTNNLIKIVK